MIEFQEGIKAELIELINDPNVIIDHVGYMQDSGTGIIKHLNIAFAEIPELADKEEGDFEGAMEIVE